MSVGMEWNMSFGMEYECWNGIRVLEWNTGDGMEWNMSVGMEWNRWNGMGVLGHTLTCCNTVKDFFMAPAHL